MDEKRGLIYFATGESNSPPAHKNTNAVIAIDLKTGKEKWSFHATPNDIYNIGCDLHVKERTSELHERARDGLIATSTSAPP